MATLIRIVLLGTVLFSAKLSLSSDEEIAEALSGTDIPKKRNDKLSLEIGDSYEIPIQESTSIQISKRGVVDAQLIPGKVRLVALKQGFVVLTLTESQKHDEDLRYFISVNPKIEEAPKSTEDIKTLSQAAGLVFSEKTMEVTGLSNKHLLFYKVKSLCEKSKVCSFSARFSELSKEALVKNLEGIFGEHYEVIIKENGAIMVLTPCSEKITDKEQRKILEHLIGNEFLKQNLLVSCKKDWYHGSYTLFSKMIVMENSTAKAIGLQTGFEYAQDFSSGISSTKLDFDLKSAIKNKKAQLIGEPVLWLLDGIEARAQSGTEILVTREKISKKTGGIHATHSWKELGLDLKVKVFPLDMKKVRLEYSFLMSSPSRDLNTIARNKLESEVELTLGRSAIVGGIQFKSSSKNESSTISFLESIPILGPIFKAVDGSETESNIFLYFYLNKAESGESTTL